MSTDTVPEPFLWPGDALAERRADGGWEKRMHGGYDGLPTRPLNEAGCPSYSPRTGRHYRLGCTAHAPGWHVATVLSGAVLGVWPADEATP